MQRHASPQTLRMLLTRIEVTRKGEVIPSCTSATGGVSISTVRIVGVRTVQFRSPDRAHKVARWTLPRICGPVEEDAVLIRMSGLKPHKINSTNSFIAGWYLDDTSICDSLIQFHKDSPEQHEGVMSGSEGATVDKESKDSTDVTLPPSELANSYVGKLNRVAEQYVAKYPWSGKLVPWGVIEPIGIQRYRPGGGYKIWHFERDNSNSRIARRHLAFMTYLNDVEEGGGTEFYHQEFTIKAEKGLTLIWPAEWNFTHRGVVSHTEEKYIITGWFSTYTKEQFERMRQRFRPTLA